MDNDKKQTTKAVKMTDEVHRLMILATKKVAVDTGGEIREIKQALPYILEYYLEKDEG